MEIEEQGHQGNTNWPGSAMLRRYLVLVIFCLQKDFLGLFQQTFLRYYLTKNQWIFV